MNQFDAAQSNGFQRTLETHFQAFKSYLDQRLAEADAKNEKRFAEADVKMERRLAEYHRATLRWMFTFFIGTVLTFLGFLITFMQITAE